MMKNTPHPARLLALAAAGCLMAAVMAPAAAEAGDPAKGSALFATHCAECHSMKEGKDKKGPSLFQIVGAKSAQRPGFAYSDAMRASALTWNAETLASYIAAPKKYLPGGKMKYDGLESAAERADLIAYLANPAKR